MLIAAICFAGMNACVRWLGGELHSFEVVFFRNFFALAWLLPWALRHRQLLMAIQHRRVYLLRSSIGLCAMYLFFYSLTVLPLADTVAITFTMPLFATAGAALFLGERVRLRRWGATALGFVGVLIILQPGANFNTLTILPLIAALFMAIASLMVKWLSRSEDPMAMVFLMTCITSPLSLVPALFVWQWPSLTAWLLLITLGGLGVLAHWAFTTAYKMADVSLVLPFDYLRLPFTALVAYMLFAEVPTASLWFGASIIVAATLYIAHRENKLAQNSNQRWNG